MHKNINNILYKKCADCLEWYPCTTEYFYKNNSNHIDGLHPLCKKCERQKL